MLTIDSKGSTIDASSITKGTIPITDVNTITLSGKSYSIADQEARLKIDALVEQMEKMFKAPKMKSISCLHCGAPLEMKVDDHIVNCAYCHSVYAIDMEMIRDLR